MTPVRLLVSAVALCLLTAQGHAQGSDAAAPAPAELPAAAEAGLPSSASPALSADPLPVAAAIGMPNVLEVLQVIEGRVAYYAGRLGGRPTSSGERHSPLALTMAHLTLPLGTLVRVTNLVTQRSVIVRVNDRGPFIGNRVADVSLAAARALNMLRAGVVHARLEVLR